MDSDTSDAPNILTRWRQDHPVAYKVFVVLTAFSVGLAGAYTGVMLAVSDVPDTILDAVKGDTEGDGDPEPYAGVTFDQEETDSAGEYTVTVQVVSLENADNVTVIVNTAGETEPRTLNKEGESTTFSELESGAVLAVVAYLDGKPATVQEYKVSEE